MSLRGWIEQNVRDLRGSWTRLDGVRTRPNRAFLARNVRFDTTGRVRTRAGLTSGSLVGGKTTSLHDWVTSGFGRVIFYEADSGKVRTLDRANFAAPAVDLYTQAGGRAAVVAEAGTKAFITVFNTASLGVGQARVALPLFAGTTDKAFSPPWTVSPVMSDIGSGNVTQGLHRFGYIVESRTGFFGKPSPQPGNVFTPASFTVAANGRTVRMTITVTVPVDAAFVHPIMTRIDNLERWYIVPDAQVAVTAGAATIQIPISISDEDLPLRAEEVNDEHGDLFQALTQDASGNGPFNPSSVFTYGTRLGWIADDTVYFSDPADYQFITQDQHAIQVPGKRRIIAGCQLRGSAYLFGPQWTYEVADNGDLPATWADPTEISSALGTPCPFGIEWRTAGDYIWVVSRAGLFVFNGQYPLRPISYYNTAEWNRINWAASWAIIVRDDYTNARVYMAVPLDANTECSHLFCWSYARGLTPEDVDFSLDDYGFGTFGTIGLVEDPASLRSALWIAPRQAGSISKEDPASTNDGGVAIAAVWESSFVLSGAGRKKINRFGGIDVSISGTGGNELVVYTVFAPDRVRNVSGTIPLSLTPGEDPQDKFDLTEEDVSVMFTAQGLNKIIDLSEFTVYHKPYGSNR